VLVRKGYVPGPDPAEWLRTSSLKAWLLPNTDIPLSPAVSDFLKAWLLTKLTEPVRAVLTIIAVPVLARRLPGRIMAFLRRP
jgi:hypothetical protein